MRTLLLTLLLAIAITNCKSQKIEKEQEMYPKSPFEIYQYKIKAGNFYKYLVYLKKAGVIPKEESFILAKECWLECNGKRFDFAPTKIGTNQEYQIIVPAWYFTMETKLNLSNENCNAVKAVANRTEYSFPPNFVEVQDKFQPFCTTLVMDDSLIVFVMDLLRLKPAEDEYFPTSERLRIVITNKLGKTIWSSDYDLNFLQIIGQVEPVEVGKVHRYIVPWNRKDNNGNYVKEGELRVSFILPVKPNNIVKVQELQLK